MSWQPDSNILNTLCAMLNTAQSHEQHQQDALRQGLDQFKTREDCTNYFCLIFTQGEQQPIHVRQLAGVLLKQVVRSRYSSIVPQSRYLIKGSVLPLLHHPITAVRRTVASIIVAVVFKEQGFTGWPQLLPVLIDTLNAESSSPIVVHGSLTAINLLCEDCTRCLEDHQGNPLMVIIPRLISLFSSNEPSFQLLALGSINQFIIDFPPGLKVNMQNFLAGLFQLASSTSDTEVQREISRAFNVLVDLKSEFVTPQIDGIIRYMIEMTKSEDEDVALEASEFWVILCDIRSFADALGPHLGHLMQVLIRGTIYSESEEQDLMEIDNANAQLSPKDIAPFFAKKKSRGHQLSADDDEDEDQGMTNPYAQFSFRKACGIAIDKCCMLYGDAILQILLDPLRSGLTSANWKEKEAAIIVLGACASGCITGLVPHLPALYDILLKELGAWVHPLLSGAACWTASRFANWVVQSRAPQERNPLIESTLQCLLKLMAVPSRKVQEASASALVILCEEAWESCLQARIPTNIIMQPYMNHVLPVLATALSTYQLRPLLILYDGLGSFFRSLPNLFSDPTALRMLMEPILNRFNATGENDRQLIPLMEMVVEFIQACGVSFKPFAQMVYTRCLQTIESQLSIWSRVDTEREQRSISIRAQRPDIKRPEMEELLGDLDDSTFDLDFVIVSLDLVSAMASAFGAEMLMLIGNDPSKLLQCLYESLKCKNQHVRSAGYVLLGDLTPHCISILSPAIPQFIPLCVQGMYVSEPDACLNSVWAIGQLAVGLQTSIEPFLASIMDRLIRIQRSHDKDLLLNVAIVLGRLGLYCPQTLSTKLEEYIEMWCKMLARLRATEERNTAFSGFCAVLMANPGVASQKLFSVIDAFSSWNLSPPPADLFAKIGQLVTGLKQHYPAQWNEQYSKLPLYGQQYLQKNFNIIN